MALLDVLNALIGPNLVLGLAIEALGAALYALELWLILRKRAQRLSPFYALFMFRALLALLFLYSVNLFNRLPALNLFLEAYRRAPNALYTAGWLINPLGIYGEFLASLALMANRYTAIAHPLLHNKIWTLKYTLGYIVCILLFAAPWGLLNVHSQGCVYPGNGSFVVFVCAPPPGAKNSVVNFTNMNALFSVCFLAAGAALNGATWRAFKCVPKSNNGSESAKLERKLAAYTLISALGCTLQALFYISVWVLSRQGSFSAPLMAVVTLFLPLNADALCWALPAALLLWASGQLRGDLGEALRGSHSGASAPPPQQQFVRTNNNKQYRRCAPTTQIGPDYRVD